MMIDIDEVFDQILMLEYNSTEECVLKDIKLNLRDTYEYDLSRSYTDAYSYLCECLLIDEDVSDSQNCWNYIWYINTLAFVISLKVQSMILIIHRKNLRIR